MPINSITPNSGSVSPLNSPESIGSKPLDGEPQNPQKAPHSLGYRAVSYLGKGLLAATKFSALAVIGLGKLSIKAAISVGKALSNAIKSASKSDSASSTKTISLKSGKVATKSSPSTKSLVKEIKTAQQEKKSPTHLSQRDKKDIDRIQGRLDRLRDKEPSAKGGASKSIKSDPFKNSTLGGGGKLSAADEKWIKDTQARLQANKGFGAVEKDDDKFIADVKARLKDLKD